MKKLLLSLAAFAGLSLATATTASASVGTASCTMITNKGEAVSWVWGRFGAIYSEVYFQKGAAVTTSPGYAQPTWIASLEGAYIRLRYENDPRFSILISLADGFAVEFKNGTVIARGTCSAYGA